MAEVTPVTNHLLSGVILQVVITPPKFNSKSPFKNDAYWKTILSLWEGNFWRDISVFKGYKVFETTT